MYDHDYIGPICNVPLTIASVNICGLYSKLKHGSLNDIINLYDITCFCETLTAPVDVDLFPNHDVICNEKVKGNRGLCIIIKKDKNRTIKTQKLCETSSEHVLWTSVSFNTINMALGVVYIPNVRSKNYSNDIFDKIEDDIATIHNTLKLPTMLVGDFNARTGNEPDNVDTSETDHVFIPTADSYDSIPPRRSNDQCLNNHGTHVLNLCKGANMSIVNGRFGHDASKADFTCHTPKANTVIDYHIIAQELAEKVHRFQVLPMDKTISDVHSVIATTLNTLSLPRASGPTDVAANNNERMFFRWQPDLAQQYQANFITEDIEELSRALNNHTNTTNSFMNDAVEKLKEILLKPAEICGMLVRKNPINQKDSRKKLKRTSTLQPWFDSECELHRKSYFTARKQAAQERNDTSKQQLRENCKRYKKLLKAKSLSHDTHLAHKLRKMISKKPQDFWKFIDSGKKGSNCEVPMEDLVNHFANMDTGSTKPPIDTALFYTDNNDHINREFTLKEIMRSIDNLPNGKAAGSDAITNECLKNCPKQVISVIVQIFNTILNTGIFPEEWAMAILTPIYKKKGPKDDPGNYRGISLLNCTAKLFTGCLNDRLTDYLESTGSIGAEQAGFRHGHSTTDHVFVLQTLVDLYLAKGKRLYCAFVDYTKAFDLIDRTSLWRKVLAMGINGKVLQVIHNIYRIAKNKIACSGNFSEYFASLIGVRQGDKLSPLLFAIYLNDFELCISRKSAGLSYIDAETIRLLSDNDIETHLRLFVLLYADDTILLCESAEELQKALLALDEFCLEWSLTVNISKTNVIIFSRGKVQKNPEFKVKDSNLQVVDCYTYLGTVFTYNGKFTKAIKKNIDSARRASYAVTQKVTKLALPKDLHLDLINKMVIPVLTYGCQAWSHSDLTAIDSYHRKLIKNALNIGSRTANCTTYAETGSIPLSNTIKMHTINFWCRTLHGNSSKLSQILLRLNHAQLELENGGSKWLKFVKNTLDECGFSFLWTEWKSYSPKWINKYVGRTIQDMAKQKIAADMISNQLCKTYRLHKTTTDRAAYLAKLPQEKSRTLAKFRTGSHKLPSHNMHYCEVPNVCPLCLDHVRPDEVHYLIGCPVLEKHRRFLAPLITENLPDKINFSSLMNSTEPHVLNILATLANRIMSLFKHP